MIGIFCKRALLERRYSAKETYNLIDPTDCSHPISVTWLIHMCVMPESYVWHAWFKGSVLPAFLPSFPSQIWEMGSHCWVTSHLSRHKCDVSQQSRHSTVIWVNSVSDFTVEWRQISQLVWRNMGNQENPLIRGFLDFPCFFTRAVRFHCWMTSMLSEQWSESTVPQIW